MLEEAGHQHLSSSAKISSVPCHDAHRIDHHDALEAERVGHGAPTAMLLKMQNRRRSACMVSGGRTAQNALAISPPGYTVGRVDHRTAAQQRADSECEFIDVSGSSGRPLVGTLDCKRST